MRSGQRLVGWVGPAAHHLNTSNPGEVIPEVTDNQVGEDLALIVHIADAVGIHDADLPVHLEDASNVLARPMLGREVGGCELGHAVVAAGEAKIRLLVPDEAQGPTSQVDRTPADGVLPEEWVAEDHHHGPV